MNQQNLSFYSLKIGHNGQQLQFFYKKFHISHFKIFQNKNEVFLSVSKSNHFAMLATEVVNYMPQHGTCKFV